MIPFAIKIYFAVIYYNYYLQIVEPFQQIVNVEKTLLFVDIATIGIVLSCAIFVCFLQLCFQKKTNVGIETNIVATTEIV